MNRRHALHALGVLALSACTRAGQTLEDLPPATETDPLSAFRVPADAGATAWSMHLGPLAVRTAPRILALSGGAEDGAFGAGALTGWTQAGTRPEFDLVTGVSTGALIAPFAFLGQSCDAQLRQIFTGHDADDIMHLSIRSAVLGNALYDTTPLEELIAHYTPDPFIAAIAGHHRNGARLLVVTSELQTSRAYAWDMGAIAEAGLYTLFRDVLRASSAMPGLFPPVGLRYVLSGRTYRETHVDGGVQMQFLAMPEYAYAAATSPMRDARIWIVVNNTLNPAPVAGSQTAIGISQQALTAMIRANAQSAVTATRLLARAAGMTLEITSIDPDAGIAYDPTQRFSSAYMNALYRHGHQRALAGTLWETG